MMHILTCLLALFFSLSSPAMEANPVFCHSSLAAESIPQTTILGENMAQRVMPFAEQTGARTLGFGSTADEWAAMTAQQRYKLNDGMLRARINEGDMAFRFCQSIPFVPVPKARQWSFTARQRPFYGQF